MGEIAIIGMAGRFPEADTLSQFYQNLRDGRDSVRSLDLQRIQATSLSAGRRYNPLGYLNDVDKFDFDFFDILESEATRMAPQQRIMLELAYELTEMAGYAPDSINESVTSVYLSSNYIDYHRHATEFDPTLLTGNLPSGISGRIARFFNLVGNAVHIDTACSSSLVALHLACQDLLSGDSKMSICGGINLVMFPLSSEERDPSGITSEHGKSKTFSDEAEGAGMGEGAACVLLKPLQDAVEHGDNILAVIKATAVNQDANRSSTIAAPSSIAQTEVISKAIEKSGLDPETITFIEAHGTGTPIGDPIEVEGLKLAFEKFTENKQFCAISALKSNIGHSDAASGIAGVVKVLLSIQHKELFPSVHVKRLNPHIDFLDTPLYVNTELKPWHVNDKRRAGVSAFGITGTNCHAIIEEWEGAVNTIKNEGPLLFCLSAKTKNALRNNCVALKKFVLENPGVSLDRISYTLNTGKQHFEHKVSVVADTHEDLCRQLDDITLSDQKDTIPSDIWFLFVPSEFANEKFINELCGIFPSFAETYNKCHSSLSTISRDKFLSYAFGYSFSSLLEGLGINVKQIMGIGVGKKVVEAILNKLSLEEVSLMLNTEKEDEISTPKWDKFAEAKLKGKKSLIWEIGVGSNYLSDLQNLKIENATIETTNPTEQASVVNLLKFIGTLFERGYSLDFTALYSARPIKVALPTYQFEKKRCWIHSTKDDLVGNWVYKSGWGEIPSNQKKLSSWTEDDIFVFHGENAKVLQEIVKAFKNSACHVIQVESGNEFSCHENDRITLDSSDQYPYRALLDELDSLSKGRVMHLFVTNRHSETSEAESVLAQGLYPVLQLTQELSKRGDQHEFVLVTDAAVDITGDQSMVDPYAASIHGFVAGLSTEFPNMHSRCIDIRSDNSGYTEALYSEVQQNDDALLIGLRHGKRYRRVALKETVERKPILIQPSGVYVLVGGSSGIGLEILKYLSLAQTTIVVIGRKKLPHKTFWPMVTKGSHPDLNDTIDAFLQAEQNGATVHYFSADVADYSRMEFVLDKIKVEFGSIKGVINAAGVGGELRINRHTVDTFKETLLPKIHGTQNLYQLLEVNQLDFFILFSSLNAISAAERESNYSTANAFLDSFAAKLNREGTRGMTIRWPFWSETGMGFRMNFQEHFNIKPEFSITNQEGVDIFNHCMLEGYTDVLISKKKMLGLPLDSLRQNGDINQSDEREVSNTDPLSSNSDSTSYEEILTDIWKKVLSKTKVDLNESFFQMGGHSLLGLQVRNQVEKRVQLKLEYKDIVEYSTINQLAHRLRVLENEGLPQPKNIILPSTEGRSKYPLSKSQTGLWMAHVSEQNKSVYNVRVACKWTSEVKKEAFTAAVQHLLKCHDILRTAFFFENESFFQKIQAQEKVDVPVEYLKLESQEKLGELFDEVKSYGFDLTKAPLIRLWVVETSDKETLVLITIHHIIIDGWSAQILLSELAKTYVRLCNGYEPNTEPSRLQFKDYVVWENEQLKIHGQHHKEFWLDYMKDYPESITFPTDFKRNELRQGKGDAIQFQLNAQHLRGLDMISNQEQASKFLITLSMLQLLLYRYTSREEFFIGTPMTLRNHNDLENQMGYFVNSMPLRCQVDKNDTFYTLLHKSQELLKSVQEHKLYPFGQIISDSNVTKEPGRHYLFDILFSYEHLPSPDADDNDLQFEPIEFGQSTCKYDIELVFAEAQSRISGTILYDSGLYTKETMTQLADHFVKLADLITLNISLDQFSLEDSEPEPETIDTRDLDFNF